MWKAAIQWCSIYGCAFALRGCVVALRLIILVMGNPILPIFQDQSIQVIFASLPLFILCIHSYQICHLEISSGSSISSTSNPHCCCPQPVLSSLTSKLLQQFPGWLSTRGHSVFHYPVNLLHTTCVLLHSPLSHQIKLRLLSLEFMAQAKVISPSFICHLL